MKAIIITAAVLVLILAVGIPVIYYATSSGSTATVNTMPAGAVVKTVQQVERTQQETPTDESGEDKSAVEVLNEYRTGDPTLPVMNGSKTGYSIGYLVNQSKAEQESKCTPLIDAAEQEIADAKKKIENAEQELDNAQERLASALDSSDSGDIEDAQDDIKAAQKKYEDAIKEKYSAQDDLVQIRIRCASYAQ